MPKHVSSSRLAIQPKALKSSVLQHARRSRAQSSSAPGLPRRRSVHTDTAFAKVLVLVNGGVPLAMLGWDTYFHQLGVNGTSFALHTTGLLGLLFLLLSLAVTPIRRWTGWN